MGESGRNYQHWEIYCIRNYIDDDDDDDDGGDDDDDIYISISMLVVAANPCQNGWHTIRHQVSRKRRNK